MGTRYLMVKKTPDQVGYSRLQTIQHENKDKLLLEANLALDMWRRLNPQWNIVVRDPTEYGWNRKYVHDSYWDDVPVPNSRTQPSAGMNYNV
jgi:hypothetical protein